MQARYQRWLLIAITALVPSAAPQASEVPASCAADCAPEKVCVPVPAKKKVTRTVYDCRDEDFCVPKCPCLLSCMTKWFHKDCCGDECPSCEKPRTRKLLIKKTLTTEEDSFKCVVEQVPCAPCSTGP